MSVVLISSILSLFQLVVTLVSTFQSRYLFHLIWEDVQENQPNIEITQTITKNTVRFMKKFFQEGFTSSWSVFNYFKSVQKIFFGEWYNKQELNKQNEKLLR